MKTQYTLLLLLLIVSGFVHAQSKKVIFNNNNQQANIVGNASINVSTGDITVQTETDKLIIDATTAGILAFYPDKYLINVGDSVELNWASAFTSACSAELVNGNAAWSGAKSHNTMSSEVVTINTLPTTLKLTCNQIAGGTTEQQFTLSQLPTGSTGGTGSIAINFTLQGQSGSNPIIAGDGPYTVVWSTSNADSCTATSNPFHSDWSGNVVVNNPTTGKVVNISGAPTLTLTCSNSSGQNSASLVFTNTGGGVVAGCENVTPPAGLSAKVHQQGDPKPSLGRIALSNVEGYGNPYADLANHGVQFGHTKGSQYIVIEDIDIPQNHTNYINGHLSSSIYFGDSSTAAGNMHHAIVSLSECAGDFDTSKTAVCLASVAINGERLYVTTNPNSKFITYWPQRSCLVEKGKSYYMNFFSGADTSAVTDSSKRICNETNPYNNTCASIIQQTMDDDSVLP
ncbi:MAG: hypothetical protein DWP95_03770 [Proteobacteria bacterium]|nr:MAG: hypothetical protein DWP95_03770 [Pseudomonadota bacterium]